MKYVPVKFNNENYTAGTSGESHTAPETAPATRQTPEDALLRMQAAVDFSLNGIAIADLEGVLNYVNDAFLHLWGFTDRDEILGKPSLSFWESEQQAREVMHQVQQHGAWTGKMSGLRKDGSRFTAQVSSSLLTNSQGTPAGMLASFLDLKAEESLKENEHRYSELFNHIGSGVAVYDAVDDGRDFVFKDINPPGEELSKVRRQEVLGKSLATVFPSAGKIGLLQVMQRVWRTGKAEYLPAVFYQDGRISHWVENRVYKLPSNEIVAIYDDFTEHKQLEENMRIMALAVEHSSDAIGMSTPDGRHYYQNRAFTKLFGEVGERPLLTGLDEPALGQEILTTIKAGDPWRGELQMRGKNGDLLDILMRASAIKDTSGEILGLVGLMTDITAQKRSESELLETRQLLEAAVAQSPLGILIAKGRDVEIQIANPASLEIHGIDLKNSEGIYALKDYSAWHAYHPDGTPYPFEELPLCRALLQGKTTSNEEFIISDIQGVRHWISVNAAPIRDPEGTIVSAIVLIEDISERKKAEEERLHLQARLAQAEKMESIGRLAGGVAHDFNNMLMVISGYAEMALQDIEPDHPVVMALNEIRLAASRSADITRQLLAFARKQTREPLVLDFNETVEGMVKMLGRLIGEEIEFTWVPGEKLWATYMDPSQANQLLANLCVNARDAIPGTGKITVETANCTLDEAYCERHELCMPGDYVSLIVTDTGSGMDATTLQSIFEPFFTTKPADQGTGLGMATVYGIVKQNNGYVDVYSEPGLGTSVKIFLPRHKGTKEHPQEDKETPLPRGNGKTILLVEDEPSILKVGRRLLERLGYTVLTTCSPGEAIRIVREHEGEIHLLISDLIMPEMSGRDLAGHILSLHPKTGVLYMSGYTAESIARHGILNEDIHFIEKPFSVAHLAQKVNEAIQDKAGVPDA